MSVMGGKRTLPIGSGASIPIREGRDVQLFANLTKLVVAASAALAVVGCSISMEPGFGEQCVGSLATTALQNPSNPTIASNIAAQVGMVPDANPNGPPLSTKQLEFRTPDGAMHYFAVQGASWERAALITLVPTANPSSITFFVVDRRGNLVQATRTRGPEVLALSIEDERVRAEFNGERELWRTAGEDATCGRG